MARAILLITVVLACSWPSAFSDPYPTATCLIPDLDGILPIADGDRSVLTRSPDFIAVEVHAGVCNSSGYVLQPTTWHRPTLFLSPPAYRSNFLEYSALQL